MAEALVNPRLLVWARERAELDADAMAASLKVSSDRVAEWETGAAHPSFTQAERWANVTHVPFGVLYAPKPPGELPLPDDFRTVAGKPHRPSPAFRDLYADVLFKHEWYRSYRLSEGFPPVRFVGSRRGQVGAETLVREMRSVINVTRSGASTGEDYYRDLVSSAEQAGVWVMRSGTVVAGNTSRAIKPDEFRGFAIADPVAPLVFVNAADSTSAQIFTLVHELAHLWLGKTGVSDPLAPTTDATERLCNAAAAEFLVPGNELASLWRKSEAAEAQFVALARSFKVSAAVVAIRAREKGLASRGVVESFLEKQRSAWKQSRKKSGGNFYRTLVSRNGSAFTRAVLSSALSQEIFIRDAGRLLNVSAAKVMEVARREGLTA